jgi:hypothetical protein
LNKSLFWWLRLKITHHNILKLCRIDNDVERFHIPLWTEAVLLWLVVDATKSPSLKYKKSYQKKIEKKNQKNMNWRNPIRNGENVEEKISQISVGNKLDWTKCRKTLYLSIRVIKKWLEKSGENQEDELAEVTVVPSPLELEGVHF